MIPWVRVLSCSLWPPWTAACQAPLLMELSEQGYWSRLPFPASRDSPLPGLEPESLVSPAQAGRFFTTEPSGKSSWFHCVYVSYSVVSNSLWPDRLQPTRLLCPWDSPGKNTRVGSHSLLRGIFPDPGIERRSPTLQADYLLSEPPEKPHDSIRISKLDWRIHTKVP